jgi:hypothetical protein
MLCLAAEVQKWTFYEPFAQGPTGPDIYRESNIDGFKKSKAELEQFGRKLFGKKILDKAMVAAKPLSTINNCLSQSGFDATLLMAFSTGETHQIMMFGDGVATITYQDGTVETIVVEYSEGAPYYLSYDADEERNERYKEQFANQTVDVKTTFEQEGVIVDEKEDKYGLLYHPCYSFVSNIRPIKTISVMSDGVHTYDKGVDATKEFVAYKNCNGEFVKRRMKALKRNCDKNGIKHYDDISIATIHLGDKDNGQTVSDI